MSTFNISQKIGGGGVFSKTTNGNTVLLTTTANQYARVRIQGTIQNGASVTLSIGSTLIRTAQASPSNTTYVYDPANPVELIIPPSSSLSANAAGLSFGGGGLLDLTGAYVIIENTL